MAKKRVATANRASSSNKKRKIADQEKSTAPEKTGRGFGFDAAAVILFCSSIMLFFFILSYFFSWKNDQSIAHWGALLERSDIDIENTGGKLGAILSEIFVGKWFGIFGLCIPVILLATSILMAKIKTHTFRRVLISTISIMIIGSIASATFAPEAMSNIFGSSLGGGYGYHLSSLLIEYVGFLGCTVIIFMSLSIWVVYTFKNSKNSILKTLASIYNIIKNIIIIPFALMGLAGKSANSAIKSAGEALQHKRRGDINEEEVVEIEDEQDELPFDQEQEILETFDELETIYEDELTDEVVLPEEYIDEQLYEIVADEIDEIEQEQANRDSEIENEQQTESYTTYPHHRPMAPSSGDNDQYSALINPEEFVLFNMPTYDPNSVVKKPTELDDDEDLFKLIDKSKDTKASANREPEPIIFEVEKPAETETQAIDDSFEVTRANNIDNELEKFEIEVTDNARISHASNSEATIKTNISEQAEQIDNTTYDPTKELSQYKLPPIDLLENRRKSVEVSEEELLENKQNIVETLENFGISIQKIKATIGPTVTLYEVVPARGVRIAKIKNLEDDIALSLKALGIRIIAPIPGKGTIGIEVPNKNKEIVSMYSMIKSVKFQESKAELPVVIGRTIQNEEFIIDLAKMPHLLVAGATGQGKSVGLNAIITSLIYKKHPAELKFVLIDPKKVEFSLYSHIEKHFLATLPDSEEAVITDFQKVIYTLNSLCIEMDGRYDLLKKAKVRNIKEYNERFTSRRLNPNNGHRYLPYFVVVIDEFGDLIMTAGREIETPIARIAQLARAVGIHMVIATQRPSVSIITGAIKANFPARIAFRVATMIDSRTILDQPGANQLIGMGDMLISTGSDITRVQCAFVDTPEVERIVEFIGSQRGYPSVYELPEYVPEGSDKGSGSGEMIKRDSLFEEVARYVVTNQQGSASTIQRNFSIGFNRAGRLMDQLEKTGIVGRQEGSKPRQVLIQEVSSLEVLLYDLENNNLDN